MIDSTRLDAWRPYMLSILRIMVALLFLQHGLGKLLGFPQAFPGPLSPLLVFAACIETFGSLLLVIGLFSRLAAFIMSGEMAVGFFMAHFPRSFFPIRNGGDAAVLYCFIFLYLVFAGPGPLSVDAARAESALHPA